MYDILNRVQGEVLVIDGGLGTMLQRAGKPEEQCPEQLNVTGEEMVEQIHRLYVTAGAECITTNTFGGNRLKLAEWGLDDQVEGLNRAAVRLAKRAGAQHVLADVGPTGKVLTPLGDASFDELFEVFAEQVSALASAQPDAIAIETMTDIAEARCAVLAARSVTDLPIFATVTFGMNGRMDLSGTDPETAAVILESAGADVVGMNCGLGPEQMLPLVERMAKATKLPIIVQPNAGLPELHDGETVFPGTADEMGQYAARFVDAGAGLVGSCCGSTPSFTAAIVDFAKDKAVQEGRSGIEGVVLAGPRGIARIGADAPFAVIGERINPTGKPELAESLREGSMTIVRSFAVTQQHAGSHLLDVNVGAAGVDDVIALPAAVEALSGMCDLPLVLDNENPVALEAALRAYPGRALINSVNGSQESMEGILPLASTYGAAVVVLALDDTGIPKTAAGRLEIVQRIRDAAQGFGLSDDDLVVDLLTMTAATDAEAARTTLEAVRVVSQEWGLATVLGVSNVSHGLPGRPALNAAFLSMAAAAGLSSAIINPSDPDVMTAVAASDALLGRDDQSSRWIARTKAFEAEGRAIGVHVPPADVGAAEDETDTAVKESRASTAAGSASATAVVGPARELASAIETGDKDAAPGLVDKVIRGGMEPGSVIGDVLTPVIQGIGDAFGRGEVFLPQLMVSAEAMKTAVGRVKEHLPDSEGSSAGRVVFATVKGDIHSIGKDICVSLLESQGFDVNDLGVDVPADDIIDAAAGADVVCLSALMTTTLKNMQATVERLAAERAGVPVFVGGAVVTDAWAESIGAGYSVDAPGCVRAVSESMGGRA